jgi:hypothetical protein
LVHTLAQASARPEQVLIDSSAVKAHRSASGEKGGAEPSDRPFARRAHEDPKDREANIHALTDAQSRPLAFMLTGGHVADCTASARLLEQLPDCEITPQTRAMTPTPSAVSSRSAARCPTSSSKSSSENRGRLSPL